MSVDNSNAPLLPHRRWLNFAFCHWVQQRDSSGVALGLEVWQWQPIAKKWCRPNEYARGGDFDHDLRGYEYVALCPTPPMQEEVDQILPLYRALLESKAYLSFPEDDQATFRRLWAEHIGRVNPLPQHPKTKKVPA